MRHCIWPKEGPDSKPSLDAVMSQTQLEEKVADYLRNSQALEDNWQRPITVEQLQVEMDRMAKHTKQPEVLRELFEALGNDPFVIAECLASNAPLRIGTSGDCETFGGLIDEVELFNRALSQQEIQAIVNAGSAGKCKVTPTPTPSPTQLRQPQRPQQQLQRLRLLQPQPRQPLRLQLEQRRLQLQ